MGLISATPSQNCTTATRNLDLDRAEQEALAGNRAASSQTHRLQRIVRPWHAVIDYCGRPVVILSLMKVSLVAFFFPPLTCPGCK